MSGELARDLLIVGTVQKPHGIRGELAVRAETDHPEAVFCAGRVFHLGDAAGKPTGDTLTVERARPFKQGMLVRAVGYTGRTPELDALRGRTLLIARDETQPLADDEVFYDELVGMRVVTADGEVGVVRDLYETTNGLLLGVRAPDRREVLIPFVREMFPRIDRSARVLELDAPPGLLEL